MAYNPPPRLRDTLVVILFSYILIIVSVHTFGFGNVPDSFLLALIGLLLALMGIAGVAQMYANSSGQGVAQQSQAQSSARSRSSRQSDRDRTTTSQSDSSRNDTDDHLNDRSR